jgi:hypothetical protein
MVDLKKLFEYKLNTKHSCDVASQPAIQSVIAGVKHNFVGYSIVGYMNMSKPDVRILMRQMFMHEFEDKGEY